MAVDLSVAAGLFLEAVRRQAVLPREIVAFLTEMRGGKTPVALSTELEPELHSQILARVLEFAQSILNQLPESPEEATSALLERLQMCTEGM